LLKTLQWLIDIHIRLTINPNLLSEAHHAYRKGRSTDTALHSLVYSIERGFRNKEYSLAAFLDIKSAFNKVTPTAFTGALTELSIERPIVGLNEMATHLRINLIWVPEHRNIEGNCIADELATTVGTQSQHATILD